MFYIWITRVGQLGFAENCHEALKVNKINDDLDKSHFVWEIFWFPLQENLLRLFCGVFFLVQMCTKRPWQGDKLIPLIP